MQMRTDAAKAAQPRRPGTAVVPSDQQLSDLMRKRSSDLRRVGDDTTSYADVRRMCELPVRAPLSPEEVEGLSAVHAKARAYRDGFRLRPKQAEAIDEFDSMEGLLGSIGVGDGKTLTLMYCAHLAYSKGRKRILLLVPSQTFGSFTLQLPWIRERVPLGLPIHEVRGDMRARAKVAMSGMPGVYIMPYSYLSTDDADDLLSGIEPSVWLCDEVQSLKNFSAARTMRVARYLKAHPGFQFAGVSGTITNKSVEDYWHLAMWALGDEAPVPTSMHMKAQLSAALDADSFPSQQQLDKWRPLRRWARTWFPGENITPDVAGLRRAFHLRLASAPGVVVSTGDNMIDTQLVLRNTPVPDFEKAEGWDKVKEYTDMVLLEYTAPNGDEIDHAIHTHKWLRELTMGFYNEQVWPSYKTVARRLNIDHADAKKLLTQAHRHHKLQQAYRRQLRMWLSTSARSGLDTPKLVGQSMANYKDEQVGPVLYEAWKAMKDLECEELPQREPKPVRLCSFKIDHAVEWAKRHRDGGIIWVHHIEVGEWLYEELQKAGISNAVHAPAGANEIMDDVGNRDKILVASMGSHGTGKNLQHHQNQLFLEWPRGASDAEQTLGRLHRTGQQAPVLVADTCDTTPYDRDNRAACLNDALYQSQTLISQRQIYCAYDPIPKTMPSAVLKERGFENKMLDEYKRLLMEENLKSDVDKADA